LKIAVYPGTFDPITNGHIDIIERGLRIFDKILVTVAVNPGKTPLFSLEERLDLIEQSIGKVENVEVAQFDGLVADYLKSVNATAMIRGLRAISDFEYEFQMSLMNRKLNEEFETVFLMPAQEYIHLNSTLIKEVSSFNGDISDYVPKNVENKLNEKFGR